jgi:predicted DNA-binding protein (UPF0251 family)
MNRLRHRLWPSRLHSRSYDFGKEYEKLQNSTLINVGAGPYFWHPNWISIDMLPQFKGTIKSANKIYCNLLDCLTLFPIDNIHAVYISHCLEHFRLEDASQLLRSIRKSMRPEAYLRIVVPNFSLILDKLRNDDLNYFAPMLPALTRNNTINCTAQDILYALCSPSPRSRSFLPVDIENSAVEQPTYKLKDEELFSLEESEILRLCNTHNFDNNEAGQFHLSSYTSESLIEILKDVGFSKVYESHFMQSSFPPMRETPLFDGTHPWMSLYVEAKV